MPHTAHTATLPHATWIGNKRREPKSYRRQQRSQERGVLAGSEHHRALLDQASQVRALQEPCLCLLTALIFCRLGQDTRQSACEKERARARERERERARTHACDVNREQTERTRGQAESRECIRKGDREDERERERESDQSERQSTTERVSERETGREGQREEPAAAETKWVDAGEKLIAVTLEYVISQSCRTYECVIYNMLIERNPPPGGVSYLLCSLIKNRV